MKWRLEIFSDAVGCFFGISAFLGSKNLNLCFVLLTKNLNLLMSLIQMIVYYHTDLDG